MNQQQLQTARAALWRQNAAPLQTMDDAAAWLDEIGLCLFLPRPTQIPAPAPSFVEAVIGAPSAATPPAAIAQATELATRLIAAACAIPLNLLGTFSEQPDFLVTPDVLLWVTAVRGDRHWKTAPAGRTSPIVVRTWAALDQHGPLTAVEIRELLGRELTEAAVLRALVELWTALRAAPLYADGEPTRWSLLRNRYARQLETAAGTALPTALSALLSVYLRSAVAATAEEAEIFLSPLTARSRIREVLHVMTAARQFGTLSLGSHTLLFVEGSLPTTPTPEAATEAAPASAPEEDRARREAIRRQSRQEGQRPAWSRGERPGSARFSPDRPGPSRSGRDRSRPERHDTRPPFREDSTPRPFEKRPFRKKPAWQPRDKKIAPRPAASGPAASRSDRPAAPPRPFSKERRDFQPGNRRDPAKPWQKRLPTQRRDAATGRPRPDRPRENRPHPERPPSDSPQFNRPQSDRPWQKERAARPQFGGTRSPGKFGAKPGFSRPGPGMPRFADSERRPESGPARTAERPAFGRNQSGPRKFGTKKLVTKKFGLGPPQKFRSDRPAPRFGKSPGQGKPGNGQGKGKPGFSPAGKSARFGALRSPRKNFPKTSAPRGRNPRKNRNQEERPE